MPRCAAQQLAADAARVVAAAGDVDLHPEQVLARLGEDLGQPDRALGVARDRVGAAGALEEHERLEAVGVDAGLLRRRLDLRAPLRDALGGGQRAAGRARVEHVARAGRGARLELLAAVGVVGERVGQRRALPVGLRARRRRGGGKVAREPAVLAVERAADGGEHEEDGEERDESAAPARHRYDPSGLPSTGRETLAQVGDELARAVEHEVGAERLGLAARLAAPQPAAEHEQRARAQRGQRGRRPPPRPGGRRASRSRARRRRPARRRRAAARSAPASRRRG